jgi:hypothetical protein
MATAWKCKRTWESILSLSFVLLKIVLYIKIFFYKSCVLGMETQSWVFASMSKAYTVTGLRVLCWWIVICEKKQFVDHIVKNFKCWMVPISNVDLVHVCHVTEVIPLSWG